MRRELKVISTVDSIASEVLKCRWYAAGCVVSRMHHYANNAAVFIGMKKVVHDRGPLAFYFIYIRLFHA